MSLLRFALLALSCLAVANGRLLAQEPPPTVDTTRGLRIQFSDGKGSTRPLQRTGVMWTSGFPRVPGVETSRDGLPLSTLDVRYAVEATDVVVTVSLSYGGPMKNLATIAIVRLAPETPVTVDELRRYGVEPITLSVVPLAAIEVGPPEGVSPSPQIEVTAEPVGHTGSAYRVTVANRSSMPLMWFDYVAHRGAGRVSASKRGEHGLPIVAANGECTFDLTVSSGGPRGSAEHMADPVHRIEIVAMMWQDGLVEGDRATGAMQGRHASARAAQLTRLLGVLRASASSPAATLRQEIARSMGYDYETRGYRDRLLAELEEIERDGRTRSGADLAAWLSSTIAHCEAWLSRIVLPRL